MKYFLFFLFGLSLSSLSFCETNSSDFQNYLRGMRYFGEGNYDSAESMLKDSLASSTLSLEIKTSAIFTLTSIYENSGEFSKAVNSINDFLKANKIVGENSKYLLITLSRLYRKDTINQPKRSYDIGKQAKNIFTDDPAVLFNFSVAGVEYAGILKQKAINSPDQKELNNNAVSILGEAFKSSQKITMISKDKEILGNAFNTMGRIQYLNHNYGPASISFKKAYSFLNKPVFHRNYGWALFGGISPKTHGSQKLEILKEVLKEFNIAIADGDDDATTKAQVPRLENEIKDMLVKVKTKK